MARPCGVRERPTRLSELLCNRGKQVGRREGAEVRESGEAGTLTRACLTAVLKRERERDAQAHKDRVRERERETETRRKTERA